MCWEKGAHLLAVLGLVVASLAAPADSSADDKSEYWAVLVAGSSGYDTYRHQDTVSSRDVALNTLEREIGKTNDDVEKSTLIKKRDDLLKGRRTIDLLFSRALGRMSVDQHSIVDSHHPVTLDMMPCYKSVVNFFTKHCVNINKNTYTLSHLYKLANLCAVKTPAEDIIKVFHEECTPEHRALTGVN